MGLPLCDAKRDDLRGVLEGKRYDLCGVSGDTRELDSRVFSVSRANRSPRDVPGAEDSWRLGVDVEGGAELSGEDDGKGRWAVDAVDTGREDLCGVLDAKRDSLLGELDNAGELERY
jgi:hypothetical protein